MTSGDGVAPRRKVFGRRQGKTLKASHVRYLEEDLARRALPGVTPDGDADRALLDLGAIFGDRDVWLEVGFGSGEHALAQAQANPDVGLLAAEPYVNGVAALLGKLRGRDAPNLRIHPGDVRDLLDVLPPASLARAFLLYPDPWPKTRHHGRRFVTPDFLDPLARAMRPGATLRVATDIPDYVRQTLLTVPRAGFRWTAERAADWRVPWFDWTRTRYEAKALREGRVPHYLTFERA